MQLTVSLILVGAALVCAGLAATQRPPPLWVAVGLLAIEQLLQLLPK